MRFSAHRPVTVLALMLAGAALTAMAPAPAPFHIVAARTQEANRTQQARAFLQSQSTTLGLSAQDDFQPVGTLTNTQGEAIVRFRQLHQGFPVYGSSAVVRVGGQLQITANALESAIRLASAQPGLTADQVLRIAHEDLPPVDGYLGNPQVLRIVFPTRRTGWVEPLVDAASGMVLPDPLRSVAVGSVTASHVWAYEVSRVVGSDRGTSTLHTIVDGHSGLILRKWITGQIKDPVASGAVLPPALDYFTQAERRALPIFIKAPQAAQAAKSSLRSGRGSEKRAWASPALGTAITQYSGTVEIPTSFDADANAYGLYDPTRGTGSFTWLDDRGIEPGNRIISDEISSVIYNPDWSIISFYRDYTAAAGPSDAGEPTGSADNVWGNGQDEVQSSTWPQPSPFSDTAKTAAAEALYGITTTYDLLNNVFYRQSYDGQDTSIVAQVNLQDSYGGLSSWQSDSLLLYCGKGQMGGWGGPYGNLDLHNGAELSSIARELGIAMHQAAVPSAGFSSLERGHLERSSGALLSQLVQAYAQRGPGDAPEALPAVQVDWAFNKTLVNGEPLFRMSKPSRDGISPDAYFDGIYLMGKDHADGTVYGEGPMNRAWYFMAQGAATDPASESYSPFLSQGMTGIGLAKTGRIFYKALTERYSDNTTYDTARDACIRSAVDLFGLDSTEHQAVANAFAAVNVGAPYGVNAQPVRVSFPVNTQLAGTPAGPSFPATHFQVVPAGQWVHLKAEVQNAANTALEWKAAGIRGLNFDPTLDTLNQGAIRADGAYQAPLKGDTFYGIQAWSKQDPRQFAQSVVWAIGMDGNGDGEVDALDFADFAMLSYLPQGYKMQLNPQAAFGPLIPITDYGLSLLSLAFNNAFAQ